MFNGILVLEKGRENYIFFLPNLVTRFHLSLVLIFFLLGENYICFLTELASRLYLSLENCFLFSFCVIVLHRKSVVKSLLAKFPEIVLKMNWFPYWRSVEESMTSDLWWIL